MSRLIEELGGYDAAKVELDRLKSIKDSSSIADATIQTLEYYLIEYKRENNIFEVGDKVVFSNTCALNHSIWQVIKSNSDIVVAPICKHNGRVVVESNTPVQYPYSIQHATDAEIEAGHRI